MGVLSKTFRDFFNGRFFEERAYFKFNPYHFQNFYEMAMPGAGMTGDVIRQPVNLDKDDIEFLQQFPAQYWAQAAHQRYEMLHKALHRLHDERMSHGFEDLQQAIKQAAQTQNWQELVNWQSPNGEALDPQYIRKIQQEMSPTVVRSMNNMQLDDEAHKHAYEYIKAKTERIPGDNQEQEFTFKKSIEIDHDHPEGSKVKGSNRSPAVTYMAKPFLNRLYHKLERTKDHDHDRESGLEGKGQYGLDLAFPDTDEKGTKFTRGMSFPNLTQSTEVMSNFHNLNQHRMFGNLPDDARWLPVHGANGQRLEDSWTFTHKFDKYRRKFESQLKLSGEKFGTAGELTSAARKMAKDAILKDIEDGKLLGPPIPGVAPQGLPVKLVNGKIVNPPLYLPHVKKMTKVKGQEPKEQWVPVVNPAHYFRELGSENSDYKRDADGNILPPEEHGYAVGPDQLRGHDKSFVHLPADPDPSNPETPYYIKGRAGTYDTGGHKASGAFHFNQASRVRNFLSPGDPGYEEAKNAVLDPETLTTDENGNEFYKDFYKGIKYCASGSLCGQAGQHERNIILQNLPAVHNMIIQEVLKDLRNPKLRTPKGRQDYAQWKTGAWVQQDLGRETRRRRILDPSLQNISRDSSTTGKEGEVSVSDTLDAQARNRPRNIPGDETDVNRNFTRRKAGDRKVATGQQQFAYSLDTMRASLMKARQDAAKADAMSKMAIVQHGDIAKLKASILDRAEVMDNLKDLLMALYARSGKNANAEEQADDQIKSWIEDGADTSAKLVSAFEQHPLVQQALQNQLRNPGQPQPSEDIAPEIEEGMAMFRKHLERYRAIHNTIEPGKTPEDMFAAKPGKLSQYVRDMLGQHFLQIKSFSEDEYNNILATIQDKINKELEASKAAKQQAPAAAAARNIQQAPAARTFPVPTAPWAELRAKQDFLKLAHHPEFAAQGQPSTIKTVIKWFDKHKAAMPPEFYQSGRDNMVKAWKARTGSDYTE